MSFYNIKSSARTKRHDTIQSSPHRSIGELFDTSTNSSSAMRFATSLPASNDTTSTSEYEYLPLSPLKKARTDNFTSSSHHGENVSATTQEFKIIQPRYNCENFSEGLEKGLIGVFDENDDDVYSEYSSCSGGEEEGGVGEKERGKELVRKERERIGEKNCKRRRDGIGKKAKRKRKEQEFRQMGSRQNNAAASTTQAPVPSVAQEENNVDMSEEEENNVDMSEENTKEENIFDEIGRELDELIAKQELEGGSPKSDTADKSSMSDEGAAITAASSLNGDGIMDMEDEAEDKRGEDDGKDISTTSDMGLDDTAVDNIKMPKAAVESVAEEPKVNMSKLSSPTSKSSVATNTDNSSGGGNTSSMSSLSPESNDTSAASAAVAVSTSQGTGDGGDTGSQFQSLLTQAQSNFRNGDIEVALVGFQAAFAVIPRSELLTPRGIRCGISCCEGIVHCYIKRTNCGKDLEMKELDYLSGLLEKFIFYENNICINDDTIHSCQLLAFVYKLRLQLQATGLSGTDEVALASEMVSTMRRLENITQGLKDSSLAAPDITRRCDRYIADAKLAFDTLLTALISTNEEAGGMDEELDEAEARERRYMLFDTHFKSMMNQMQIDKQNAEFNAISDEERERLENELREAGCDVTVAAASTVDTTTTQQATTSRTSSQARDSSDGLDGFSMKDLCAKTNVDGLSDYKGNDVFRKEVKRVFGDKLDKIIQHVENTRGLDGVAIHDGYIECVGDIRRVFFGNYPPSTNLDRVKKRLLWLGPDGLPGEKCWRTMFVTLIDIYVRKYGWEYEVAKNFVMRTTVVINRTPVLMHGSIRKNNETVYEESVKFTDELNKEFIQKIIPQMKNPNLHLFMFGEPVYETLNDLLRSIASGCSNVSIPQTDKLDHMLRYHICWAKRQSFENLHNGFNMACASSQGIKPEPITSEEHRYLSGTKKKGWSMCDLVEEEEREALLKDYNADEKAKEAFQTVEEFALYKAEASDKKASYRVLVWRMEEITDANIQLTWKQTTSTSGRIIRQATVNDDVKRQLANIKPLVKCTHKHRAEDSVELRIGGCSKCIGAINTVKLTQLREGKFVAIQLSTKDRDWPFWPLIEVDQRGVTLPPPDTFHAKEGFTLRKKVLEGGVETWPKVVTSLGRQNTASWMLGCANTTFSNLSKSTETMVVSGISVKYIPKGEYRFCQKLENEEEGLFDSSCLKCADAFLHQDHWDDLVTSLRVRRNNVLKTHVIAYNKKLRRGKPKVNGWKKKD